MFSVSGDQKRSWKLNSMQLKRIFYSVELSLHLFQLGAVAAVLWNVRIMATAWDYTLCSCFQLLPLPIWERVNQSLHSWGKSVRYRKQGILHGGCMLFWGLNAWRETCTPGVPGWVEKCQPQLYWEPTACHWEKRRAYHDSCSTRKQGNLTVRERNWSSTFPCREESQFLGQLIPGFLKNNYIIEENKNSLFND